MNPRVARAPDRPIKGLSPADLELALTNHLRYVPEHLHARLAPEFAEELLTRGRIYAYRYRPDHRMWARPIDDYPGNSLHARAIMLMFQNNLDPEVAQFPYEGITYGGNGTCIPNWLAYRLKMKYLAEMTDRQTLVMMSGLPLGLFPSSPDAPRMVVANGMMVPNYSTPANYLRLAALGVTSYGQMTAGSDMYIGSQGIVQGTYNTLIGAGRILFGADLDSLAGTVFVTSGLGGMSGAQGKAAVMAGAVGVIAEVNPEAAEKRRKQGWVNKVTNDLDEVARLIEEKRASGQGYAIAYVGNIVDLWDFLLKKKIAIDIGTDQTALNLPYEGGYYPAGMTMAEAKSMMQSRPGEFKRRVDRSVARQIDLVDRMIKAGLLKYYFDYGNGLNKMADSIGKAFNHPSYVQDIMGPTYFDFGFGPYRWVCLSGKESDLEKTDRIAATILRRLADKSPREIKRQYGDNLRWVLEAGRNKLVIGSQARILYSDFEGRVEIALAMNEGVRNGDIGPIVIGRDHHDTGGTDSPHRETANIYDGSNTTADMSIQNVIGNAIRGATWVSCHNGGGVGWGEVNNCGFGKVLDGTRATARKLRSMLRWDVGIGIARRNWAGKEGARFAVERAMKQTDGLQVTQPHPANESVVAAALERAAKRVGISI